MWKRNHIICELFISKFWKKIDFVDPKISRCFDKWKKLGEMGLDYLLNRILKFMGAKGFSWLEIIRMKFMGEWNDQRRTAFFAFQKPTHLNLV